MTSAPPVVRLGVDARELRAGVRTGIRRYVVEVVRAAVGARWSVVLYGDRDTAFEAEGAVSSRVLASPCPGFFDQVALPFALRADAVDVFLSPYYKGPLLAPCPVALTIHDLFFIGYPGRRRPLYDAAITRAARLYARRAALIVADSEHSRRAVVTRLGVSADKVHVVPVALGAEFRPVPLSARARARCACGDRYVLYVGNFKPHKNLGRLLRAWASLPHQARAGHRLVLAGGDDPGELSTLAQTLGIADRVAFPGRVPDEDLPALYGAAATVVLPSLDEGFGLPALEAMACGAPVVATNRGAVPEVVGDAALSVDPESEAALAGAIASVLSDAAFAKRLRDRGIERARLFTPDRTAARVIALLRGLVTGARERPRRRATEAG